MKALSDSNNAPAQSRVIRFLHITESAQGGVGTYLNQILPELHDWCDTTGRHADMRLLMPESHRLMVADLPVNQVSTYRRSGRSLGDLMRFGVNSIKHIFEFKPDIVHLHSTFAGVILRPCLMIFKLVFGYPRAVVYSPHGWAFQIPGSRFRRRAIVTVEKLFARITSKIIVLSDAEKAECINLGIPENKLVRIYNGISAVPKTPIPAIWDDNRLKIFFIGRFDRQKGLDTLFQAAALAPEKIVVRCAGSGVVGDDETINAPSNVELLGWINEAEIEGQLKLADYVAIPSRWEGFGLVALEAMRARLPVVASDIGGLPEVVADGETGHLVPPENPKALLDALLADDAEQRHRLGEAGHQRFLKLFTSALSAKQLGKVYSDLSVRVQR
jgi:glycosyltransferase involved in cell wall biosynthesis